jgi:hypothetical protein
MDDRLYVRLPAYGIHVLVQWIRLVVNQPVRLEFAILPSSAIASGYLAWPGLITFGLNYATVIYLAFVMDFAAEELSEHYGRIAKLMSNYLFCNIVLLIVSVHPPPTRFQIFPCSRVHHTAWSNSSLREKQSLLTYVVYWKHSIQPTLRI